jgi:hypothetical protein
MHLLHGDRAAVAPGARRPRLVTLACVLALAVAAFAGAAMPQFMPASAQTLKQTDESPEDLPPGPGRDDTFYLCTACHGFKIVAQQGMNRPQWEDSIDWMTEKHGMPKLEGEQRNLILDYLVMAYPPKVQPRGSPNPFLDR